MRSREEVETYLEEVRKKLEGGGFTVSDFPLSELDPRESWKKGVLQGTLATLRWVLGDEEKDNWEV